VIFVLRTARNPLRSRPSGPLLASIVASVAVGAALPYTPLANTLGFVPLPALFFAVLLAMVLTYLFLVESIKRRVYHRYEL